MYNCIAIPSLCDLNYEIMFTDSLEAGDFVEHSQLHNIEVAKTKNYTLLRIVTAELTKSQLAMTKDTHSPIYHAGYEAYKELFGTIKKHRMGRLVRIWNYVPQILVNEDDSLPTDDRERYRQFNAGRSDAWDEFGPHDESKILLRPSATGIGSHGGPLIIECLLSHNPVHYIENPRQTPAYNYPEKYGSKAPAFARGTLMVGENLTELYIAGTASIVKSETKHHDKPAKQVVETFKNIKALISHKNLRKYNQPGFSLHEINGIRVYIKNPSDYPVIRRSVEKIIGTDKDIIYLNDDICRPDLLLEIEGIAQKICT